MVLPEKLHGLGIIEVYSRNTPIPHDLQIPLGSATRTGASCEVHRIKNPTCKEPDELVADFACKTITLDQEWKIDVVKNELFIYRKRRGASYFDHATNLIAAYYIEIETSGELGKIYLVLVPWVDLSLHHLILHAVGERRIHDNRLQSEAPWYGYSEIWPMFLLDCLFFLLDISANNVYDINDFFSRTTDMDSTLDSIQVRGYERDNTDAIGRPGVLLSPILGADPIPYANNMDQIRHKDLKPDNILIWNCQASPQDQTQNLEPGDTQYWQHLQSLVNPSPWELDPIFVDFGLSKIHDPSAIVSENLGTNLYRAPEQQADNAPNLKSDVWSLGCCFTFVEAFMHSGEGGVRAIYDITIGANVAFRDRSEMINMYLDSAPSQQLLPRLESMRKRLRKLVKTRMMTRDLAERYHAYQVWYTWFKIVEEAGETHPLDVRDEEEDEDSLDETEERDDEDIRPQRPH